MKSSLRIVFIFIALIISWALPLVFDWEKGHTNLWRLIACVILAAVLNGFAWANLQSDSNLKVEWKPQGPEIAGAAAVTFITLLIATGAALQL